MKIRHLATYLLLLLAFDHACAEDVKKRMEINVRPQNQSLVGCLVPAFRAAGRNWSRGFLYAYGGQAFVFNMKEGGGDIWHDEDYVYGAYSIEMLRHLGKGLEIYNVALDGENPVSVEEMNKVKAQAWNAVRDALDNGLPAVVWQPISAEMAAEHPNAMLMRLPAMWSLIVGYDELANTYVVDSPASRGRFTIGRDAFGHVWPRSKKFCVIIIKPETGSFDAPIAHRTVLQRAIEASKGMRPGTTRNATTHGLAAWDMWLDNFRKGTVATRWINDDANFVKASRGWAAVYLKEVAHHFPEKARIPLNAATEHYKGVSDAMKELRALEHERAALADLQRALDSR